MAPYSIILFLLGCFCWIIAAEYTLPEAPDCGQPYFKRPKKRIIGGSPAKNGQFPWMVVLGYGGKTSVNRDWKCGGSLITTRHVLTAAHCVHNQDLRGVRFGDVNVYATESIKYRTVDQIFEHEEFDPISMANDIAILKLDKDIAHPNMTQICIPTSEMVGEDLVGFKPYIAGWGLTDPGVPEDESEKLLRYTQVEVFENTHCKDQYKDIPNTWTIQPNIRDSNLCAGTVQGGKDSCTGDSGGPLMAVKPHMQFKYYAVGLVSYGKSCGLANFSGVYTRMDQYIDWIKSKINL